MNPAEVVYKIAKKAKDLSNEVPLDDVIKTADVSRNILLDPKKNLPDPTIPRIFGTGITLTNNEIKDIMKVIKSLETRKNTSKEGGFLNFLRLLLTAGLPLMRNILTPLAKNVLLPFTLSPGMSSADAAIEKKIYGSGRH